MKVRPGLNRIPILLFGCCAALTLWLSGHGHACDSNELLAQGEPNCIPMLIKRFQNATEMEKKDARWFLQWGEKCLVLRRWQEAAYHFKTDITGKPTPRAYLGLAVSVTRMIHKGLPCAEIISEDLTCFEDALEWMDLALDLGKALGSENNLDDKTLFKYHNMLVNSQKLLLERQRKCLGPSKGIARKAKTRRR